MQGGRLEHPFDEIIEGKSVVVAEGTGKGEETDNADDEENGGANEAAENEEQPLYCRSHRDPHEAAHRFSRYRDVGIFFQIIPLDEEHRQGGNHQHHGQYRSHGKIPRPDDLRVSLRRQHMIIRPHQHGIAEIR